ncbi:UNVERIFIED_CONTAM: Subtilisin-like protease SBT4.6 [Sesamum calycinum]|uniref:Subtilisin-like protease SBT4.6 n=1 Tax=Sesamum calycinum TaxID=2727403 RepID=A0AAW2PSV2_9LAMI
MAADVGTSSIDRGIVTKVTLGNGKTIVDKAVNSFKMNGTQLPFVYGEGVTSRWFLDRRLVRGLFYVTATGASRTFYGGALGTVAKSGQKPDISSIFPLPAPTLNARKLDLVQKLH